MKVKILPLMFALIFSGSLFAADSSEGSLDEVLASRGEGKLTHLEFDARMHRIPEEDRSAFIRDPSRLERVIADLLLQKQLAAAATAAGFSDNAIVRARMKLASEAELATAWLDEYVRSQPDADFEALAREQYLIAPEQFKSPLSIDVSHILISVEKRGKEEALALAQDISAKLNSDPTRFDEFVMAYSDDPSAAANNGQFKGVKKGDMVKPFETTAFALTPGAISEPVLTQYGYHVIRADQVNEPAQLAFDVVKGKLIEAQKASHERRLKTHYIEEFTTLDTNLTEDALRTMLLRYFEESELTASETP